MHEGDSHMHMFLPLPCQPGASYMASSSELASVTLRVIRILRNGGADRDIPVGRIGPERPVHRPPEQGRV